jgi:hypothetical protein
MPTFEEVLKEATQDGRVCPQPSQWSEFWQMLPDKKRNGAGWEPPLPLILAAWHDTPHLIKAIRFREHIKWAADHDALDAAYAFISKLNPEDWFYGR